jgi:hypothetical protein
MNHVRRPNAFGATVRSLRALLAGAALFVAGTAPAFANAGMGIQVVFPPSVTVGQTNVAANIDIQNTSTPDTLTIQLDTYKLVPACGGYSIITCSLVDPGVFAIDSPALGRAGTACAGVSFLTALTGDPDGSYSFTPLTPVTLGTPGSATDKCIIDFTFDVLKAPTQDASGAAGLQTLPSALVTGTASDTSIAAGFGTAFFVTVSRASPTISTIASPAVVAGGNIFDTATLAGGDNPTGSITFTLYGPDDATCAGPVIFTNVKAVSGNGSYASDPFTANLVGTYRWIAAYSGDPNNNPVSGACNDANESVVVTADSPTMTTNASAAITLGGTVTDTATLLNGTLPTGSITFRLYGPDDATCANAPVFTSSAVAVNGNGSYVSAPAYQPTAIGTYRWIASYSGDANNNPIAGACNDANESVVVSQATPSIATTASAGGVIGVSVTDSATLSGGFAPTGSIVFRLYGPSATIVCDAGNLVFTSSPIAVTGNGSYGPSDAFTPTAPGTYRWIASYSGDTNNAAVAGACGDANETVMITRATPTIATTASTGGAIGTALSDTATVSGGSSPTGTVTFNLYGPNDATCSGAVIHTSTVALSGGSATSTSFTTVAAGTYRWTATYNGDANNNTVVHPCNSPNESAVIVPSTPTIATVASAGGPIGTQISDVATLSGGTNPTGTITFRLYGPDDAACTGAIVFTSTVAVSAGGATSAAYTTTAAGVYRWTASYSGDANNDPVSHPCNSPNESATIDRSTPSIATVASAGGVVGTSISDTATVTGGTNPTGTVTFNLYGPNDAACSGSVIHTSTVALSGGSATSTSYATTAPGVYRWTASYSGDANNNAVSHPCNSPNESATITQATPTIVTTASAGGAIGTQLSDTATVSGGFNPTGTVTFNLYGPNDASCSGTVIHTSTVALSAGSATSTSFTTVAAGVYRWTATYNGDANNAAVSHPCNSPNESATIGQSTPTIATTASAGGPIGTQLSDVATVSGGSNPTGTVTFNLYGPNDASCSGAVIHTSTVALSGGSATSTAFTTVAAGVYRWTATYNGDANNIAVSHPCNSPNESATIAPSSPTIATVASAGGQVGVQVSDTATVSGGSNPTGTVTFNLYGPNDATCSTVPVHTSTVPLVAGSATSSAFAPTLPGTYRWIASYSGDANNNAVSGACNDANESVTITAPPPDDPPRPVPTLSAWALMLLALLTGATAMATGRRRRR